MWKWSTHYYAVYNFSWGLGHCATSRAVPGSNPSGVGHRDFFSWIPTEPCALGSTQPLKNEYQGFPWGKGGRCVRLTTYHPCSAERQEIRGLNLPGPPWAISTFTFTFIYYHYITYGRYKLKFSHRQYNCKFHIKYLFNKGFIRRVTVSTVL